MGTSLSIVLGWRECLQPAFCFPRDTPHQYRSLTQRCLALWPRARPYEPYLLRSPGDELEDPATASLEPIPLGARCRPPTKAEDGRGGSSTAPLIQSPGGGGQISRSCSAYSAQARVTIVAKVLHHLFPLFISSAAGFAVEDGLRRIRGKAQALESGQRPRRNLDWTLASGDCSGNGLGARVGSKREANTARRFSSICVLE